MDATAMATLSGARVSPARSGDMPSTSWRNWVSSKKLPAITTPPPRFIASAVLN